MSRVFVRYNSYHIDLGRDEGGRRRSKKLCRVTEGESALYAALARHTKPAGTTVDDLINSFLLHGMKDLAPRTQADYRSYAKRLKATFGEMSPDDVERIHIAQYFERRKEKAKSGANKEIACFASAFQYGMRNGLCSHDPTKGVKRNRVKPKDRYVRHDEFLLHFNAAPDHVQDLMAGIYLMGLRPGEARELRQTEITPQGVRFQESKTGKVRLISWSPAMQFFLTRATTRAPKSPYVFTNSQGGKWGQWAMHSALRRLRAALELREADAAEKEGRAPEKIETWTWHDLRAKAESDHKDGMGLLTLYKRAYRTKPVA